ncbi:P-loop containing nucleoside triphosphate hydrolase protein [Crassisporium funariophilum]|nr:P-loop containing nucleoside triphosphate hydrolase protein [Crassisporium funariophilum]
MKSTPGNGASEADEFVNVWIGREDDVPTSETQKTSKDFYGQWIDKASAKFSSPPVTGADALRHLHPNHSLVMTQGYGIDILGFPAAQVTPLEKTPLITNLIFIPIARSLGTVPGILVDQIQYGVFKVTWQQFEFLIYLVQYPTNYGNTNQYFILHEGPEEVSRLLILASGAWSDQLHDEIWVFNQGFWRKDQGLWKEVQKADWKDVILKDAFKKALQKDVYGFFASEAIYKELAIPWKRGIIMHGPPGNGKTISLKTIMKTCGAKGFSPLYVKSFQSWKGEEGAMEDVFDKARQLAPCVVILEDLDSLINDRNRSFFLNQLDGLEGNDGLLVIGTTNHFDRLDPGLSTRPSRFDRKFKFDDPDEEERKLYAQYWQRKLASNKEIDYPDPLVDEVAKLTDKFSFAYLKEAFVSSLVTLLGIEGEKPEFSKVLKDQIEALRKQLDKSANTRNSVFTQDQIRHEIPSRPSQPSGTRERDVRALLDALSESAPRVDNRSNRIYESGNQRHETEVRTSRDIRALLDAVSDSLTSLDLPSVRAYEPAPSYHHRDGPTREGEPDEGKNFRALLDRITSERDRDMLADKIFHPQRSPTTFSNSNVRGDWQDRPLPNAPQNPLSPHPFDLTTPRPGVPNQFGNGGHHGADLA